MTTYSDRRIGLPAGAATGQSKAWFDRAKRVLAGGISSSARSTTTGDLPYPLYVAKGLGSHVWDADGNEFIDYLLSYGSTILGHADGGLSRVLEGQLASGTMFGTCNTLEVELAELICKMVPCAELVRYSNSGSEAICGAVRAARGFTGKNKILKFEGHYHGWVDLLAVSNRPSAEQSGSLERPKSHPHSKGIPVGVVEDVVIAPWNEPAILKRILNAHGGEIGTVIAEPVVANNGCIMPVPGFLEFLREECTNRGMVLIYDEIVTGFRLARGGAQEYFNVTPDMAVFSKAIGGGLPIAAFAGRRDIMKGVGENTVKHGGTYNGNPLCAAAALHVLRSIDEKPTLGRIMRSGERVMEQVRKSSRDRGISCVVQGAGSMFQVIFNASGRPLRHYRDLLEADAGRYGAFRQRLLDQGIHANGSGSACWFVSAAHTADDVTATCEAVDEAMAAAV